jgi:hypothetical protein
MSSISVGASEPSIGVVTDAPLAAVMALLLRLLRDLINVILVLYAWLVAVELVEHDRPSRTPWNRDLLDDPSVGQVADHAAVPVPVDALATD